MFGGEGLTQKRGFIVMSDVVLGERQPHALGLLLKPPTLRSLRDKNPIANPTEQAPHYGKTLVMI